MPRSVFSKTYGELLRALIDARDAAGLTQTDVAQRLRKPQSFVSKVERGERRLDVIEFLLVARVVGADGAEMIREIAKHLPSDLSI